MSRREVQFWVGVGMVSAGINMKWGWAYYLIFLGVVTAIAAVVSLVVDLDD